MPPTPASPTPAEPDYTDFFALLDKHENSHVLRSGIDYHQEKLWYGMEIDGKLHFLTSGNAILEAKSLPIGITAPSKVSLPSPLSNEGIKRYLLKRRVDGRRLIAQLEHFFRSHAKFQFDTTPNVLAHWALGTYLYMAFPIYGYIWLTSHKGQSGKSRVLELISAVSFRCPGITMSVTPATVFRSVDQEGYTLVVDEFEKARDDAKAALIEIFNAGFNISAKVPRCNNNDSYKVEWFRAYCPKVFAGLSDVPDTLATRSMQLRMFPKSAKDRVQEFSLLTSMADCQPLRDDMAIWALDYARACAALVKHLAVPACLDDRAKDFMTPLYTISQVANTDRTQLDQFSEQIGRVRRGEADESPATIVLTVLRDWFPKDGSTSARIHCDRLGALLTAAGHYTDEKVAGKWLRSFEFEVRQIRIPGYGNKKGAEISKVKLAEWMERYNVPATPEPG
jgi:hypothetical protein